MIGAPCRIAAIPPQTTNSTSFLARILSRPKKSGSTGSIESGPLGKRQPSDAAGEALSVAEPLGGTQRTEPANQVEVLRLELGPGCEFAVVWELRHCRTLLVAGGHVESVPETR